MAKLSGNITNFTFAVLGAETKFSLAKIVGKEGISALFEYTLTLVSEDENIDFASIIGKAGVVKFVSEHDDVERYIHGMIVDVALTDQGHRFTTYVATLVPRVWNLTQMKDCRIFQVTSMDESPTTPNIIRKILVDAEIPGDTYKIDCKETYAPRDYCVQYRESDWDFIARLMEEEGIFYYFEHSANQHLLVIADKAVMHKDIGKPAQVLYQKPSGTVAAEDTVHPFNYAEGIRTGGVMLNDYLFRKPALNLRSKQDFKLNTELEVYDYPGRYPVTDLGDDAEKTGKRLTQVRMEAAQVDRMLGEGKSDCMRFTAGYRFTLAQHGRKALNQAYLLIYVHLTAEQPNVYEEGADGKPSSYSNNFVCIPASVQYRSSGNAKKPIIPGAQTAIVTGLAGEEVYTDEFGRVKVQFHWDREGKNNEKSSCWLRVSQVWAGAGWGAMFIPRVGHEVIVEFLEGDPDRPIITGRVYHGTNKPPYALPEHKTRSTIKSDSSKGGCGSNELRFEDKKDSEEIYLHGQKDWNIRIENDTKEWIGHDRHLIVMHDQLEKVEGDKHQKVIGDHNIKIDGTLSIEAGADMQQKTAQHYAHEAGNEIHLKAGQKVVIEAGVELTIKAGGSFVKIDASGVTIVGAQIKLNSGGSAGSGSGASPEVPKVPMEVAKIPPTAPPASPAAIALKNAAQSGTPFCEECERKKKEDAIKPRTATTSVSKPAGQKKMLSKQEEELERKRLLMAGMGIQYTSTQIRTEEEVVKEYLGTEDTASKGPTTAMAGTEIKGTSTQVRTEEEVTKEYLGTEDAVSKELTPEEKKRAEERTALAKELMGGGRMRIEYTSTQTGTEEEVINDYLGITNKPTQSLVDKLKHEASKKVTDKVTDKVLGKITDKITDKGVKQLLAGAALESIASHLKDTIINESKNEGEIKPDQDNIVKKDDGTKS